MSDKKTGPHGLTLCSKCGFEICKPERLTNGREHMHMGECPDRNPTAEEVERLREYMGIVAGGLTS